MTKYYTEAQKQSIMKWRDNNKEEYNIYMNEYHKKFYQSNAERLRKRRMDKYYFQKEWKRLCGIFSAFEE